MTAATASIDPNTARYALSVNGKVYGPYSLQQMRTYATEGRVTASSLISRENGPWGAATDDPSLADVFTSKLTVMPAKPVSAASRTDHAQPAPSNAREAFLKELQGVRHLKTPTFAAF